MTASSYDRQLYGVDVRSTMIYERTLELTHKLCWNSEDLGISRVHLHNDQTFKSRSALEKYCRARGEAIPEPKYYFDWLDSLKGLSGGKRQKHLREEHWCNREQIINILLDTAMQAYQSECQQLLCAMTGEDFRNAALVKFVIKNHARQYTGDPDTAFIDLKSRNIALIEIKIGSSTTKYSLDQCVKYETLSALLCSDGFFPGFQVHKVLLCPTAKFSANTVKPRLLRPSTNSEGQISFAFDAPALAALKPGGYSEIESLVAARVDRIADSNISIPTRGISNGVLFYSWETVERLAPPGLLRENISALMGFLAPKQTG